MPAAMPPGYLNTKQAAAYLGYSVKRFSIYAREGSIPRRGPRLNRFRIVDLDAFMENPRVFVSQASTPRPRTREGFTPIRI
ncbi:MAG: helix-turn-helix domain-containing protein [Desulfovibrio sp.]|jgi:hypothetical protein|nr:helix-turn-helix domain-containing protein [Desulfovibrio sp.]